MRVAIGIGVLWFLIGTAAAQDASKAQNSAIHVRKLTLIGGALPDADRQQIALAVQGMTFKPSELAERVRQQLRDRGFYFAKAETPQVAPGQEESAANPVDVSMQIETGSQYHFGEIKFEGATAFPADQMRGQIAVKTGELFNASVLASGLDQLKKLYLSEGYFDLSVVPVVQVDEQKHSIDIRLNVDEGEPYNFGNLFVEGQEPQPGAEKALLASWADFHGRRYDPQLVDKWLSTNMATWPKEASGKIQAEDMPDPEAHLVNLRIHFQ